MQVGRTMRFLVLPAVLAGAMSTGCQAAQALPSPAPLPPLPPGCSDFMKGRVCPTTGSLVLRTGATPSDYYGYVKAKTDVKFAPKDKASPVVAFFTKLMGGKENYTAKIELELRLKANNQERSLGTYSLLGLKVVNGGVQNQTDASVDVLPLSRITEDFSLRQNAQVVAIFRTSVTEDTSISVAQFLGNVAPLTAAAGGGLATFLASSTVTSITPIADNLLSNKEIRTIELRTILGAANGEGKTVVFTAPSAGGVSASDFNLTLTLTPKSSLLKEVEPDQALQWDSSISNPETQIVVDKETLGKFLTNRGVPVSVSLIVPTTPTPPTLKARVQQTCKLLADNLTAPGYIPLNQFDSEVVIYQRLKEAELNDEGLSATCIQDRQRPEGVWTKFGIPPLVEAPPALVVSKDAAAAMFKKLNLALVKATPVDRREALNGIKKEAFLMTADMRLFPGQADDFERIGETDYGRVSGMKVLSNLKSCALGAYYKTPADALVTNRWSALLLPDGSSRILSLNVEFGRDDTGLVFSSIRIQARPDPDLQSDSANPIHDIKGSDFAKDPDVQKLLADSAPAVCT